MNTLRRIPLFLIFFGAAALLLPACGSKSTVKSEKASETVLNPESTTTDIGTEDSSSDSYVAKIHSKKNTDSASTVATDGSATTTAPVASGTPAMETAAPVEKGGFPSWLLWVLAIAALGGVGYYVWAKRQAEEQSSQPMPPVGGLSPVSGFTALKDHIEEETLSKSSIWSKKLF